MFYSLQFLFRLSKSEGKSTSKSTIAGMRKGRSLFLGPLGASALLSVTMSLTSVALAAEPLPSLQVSGNGRYLVQEDGTPFYWQADDAWALTTRLDFDVTVPGTGKNEVEYYLDTRASQGFNVIHDWLIPGWQTTNTEHQAPFVGRLDNANPVVLNSSFFDNVNAILDTAESKGLYVMIELGAVLRKDYPAEWWLGGFDAGNDAADHAAHKAKAYEFGWKVSDVLRGHSNLLWGFGQDTVPTRANRVGSVNAANNGEKYVELVQSMAEGVADATNAAAGASFNSSTFDASADYETTIMSFHTGATRVSEPVGTSSSEWFHNDQWLDFNMNQGGRRSRYYDVWHDLVENGYELSPAKPIVEGEGLYDHARTWDDQSYRTTAYDVRVQAYWTTFAGAFGYSYGHHSVWQMYNPARYNPRAGANVTWYDVLDTPGAEDMIHVNNLLRSRPFLSRVPNQDILDTAAGTGYQRLVATGDSSGSYALIYSTNGRSFDVDLSQLSGSTIKAWWYNPSDGKLYDGSGNQASVPFDTFANAGGTRHFDPPGSATSKAASNGNDWVLVLDDASKAYGIPGVPAMVVSGDYNNDGAPEVSPGGPPAIDLERTDIFPHRGGKAVYPENTLYGFKHNLSDGTSLDMDIRKTADSDIVVIHDATTRRTTDGNLTVAKSTVAQLQALDAAYKFNPAGAADFPLRGKGITIPTLDAVFSEFVARRQPKAIMWIDLKDDTTFTPAQNQRLYDRLIELIGKHNVWDQAHVEVSSTSDANELMSRDPRVKVVFWSKNIDELQTAIGFDPYVRIGMPIAIANQMAAAVHASGKGLHVTDRYFSTAELDQLKPSDPNSLGCDSYQNLIMQFDPPVGH